MYTTYVSHKTIIMVSLVMAKQFNVGYAFQGMPAST